MDPPFRSIDLFQNESRAYSHLKARGFCQRGVVPDFYGVIKSIDPETPGWQPDLKKFYDRTLPEGLDHKPRPDGVLIEYIPNIKKIDLDNYTEERVRKIRDIFFEIMDAGVIHMDDYPRNMMVQPETDRVLWIDFDRAQTLPYGPLDFYVQDWFEMDVGMTDQLMDELVGHQILFEFIILPLV